MSSAGTADPIAATGPVAAARHRVRPGDPAGLAWAALLGAAWFAVGLVRFRHLHAGASDLGIFDQAAWLMSRGRAPFVTVIGLDVFADHVSPVLVLFAPLYRLVATPLWLIGAQATCLGLTVLPMRALARELGAPPWLATLLVGASPVLLSAATYDVHPVVFATPAVAWALLAARRDDARTVTIAGLLVACCRADAVVALAGAAFIAGPRARRRLLLLVPVPLVASVVIPHHLGTWQTFGHYYHRLGTGFGDLAMHPWRVGVALVASTSLFQLVLWLLPVGFLPLLRPRWFAGMVVGGLPLLLSSWGGIPVPWFHHAAYLVPFAVGGALDAVATASRSAGEGLPTRGLRLALANARARAALGAIALGLIAGLVLTSPFSPRAPAGVRFSTSLASARPGVAAAIAAVGPHEGVTTQGEVLSHLTQRTDAYLWPCPFAGRVEDRWCGHQNLVRRPHRVDVVVLLGHADAAVLRRLGFPAIRYHDGITEARRRRRP
ncbi:MAG: hypothetical protein JWM05_1882 [Acidimicrobiales bacterium]|nr:hypothetical protein [Acidimicrobiales bacterium]